MAAANTLAYYDATIMTLKRFLLQAQGVNAIKIVVLTFGCSA
jgi:hypothetical protein